MLYHGGKEHYAYPTPKQQDISRFFVEEGVDVVISQHSHIAGSYEKYLGKLIVYGQGNFLFEKLSRNIDSWYTGFLVSLKFNKSLLTLSLFPLNSQMVSLGLED